VWLCDVRSEGSRSARDLALFFFRLSSSFPPSFTLFAGFPVFVSFLSVFWFFCLFERLAKVEYCEHSPRPGLGDVCVIASCIAAGFEIPFVTVWGQLIVTVG
jgi:hypothetical protein